jgi:hypothetical protein
VFFALRRVSADRADLLVHLDAYYHDVHHPLAKHKVSDKMSEEEVLVRMQAQLDKIAAMAKSLWWHEKITVKSGEYLKYLSFFDSNANAIIPHST